MSVVGKKRSNKLKRYVFTTAAIMTAAAVAAAAVSGILLYRRGIIFSGLSPDGDTGIKGVSVSCVQGIPDWEAAAKRVDFAYIKATEGAAFKDRAFEKNYSLAAREKIILGFSHTLTGSSSGKAQADNFFAAVGDLSGRLPPAVEIKSAKAEYRQIFRELAEAVHDRCGTYPAVICSSEVYQKCVAGAPVCWVMLTDTEVSDREFVPLGEFPLAAADGKGQVRATAWVFTESKQKFYDLLINTPEQI